MVAAGAVTAGAQSLGTFRWQLQPYCNVVTVQIVQQGAVYTLDGFDDQCGAPQRAPLVGLATPNPDGSIGFGLHIVAVPDGRAVQVEARIGLPSLAGEWRDSQGGTGTFVFNGSAAGERRPASASGLPLASISGREIMFDTLQTGHVADGALLMRDLLNGPRGAYASGDQTIPVSDPTVVRTASLTAPAAGRVLVTATGVMQFANASAVQEVGWCYFRINGTGDQTYLITADDGASTLASRLVPFSSTFGIDVVAAGAVTVDLVCAEPFPANTNLTIRDTGLTLMYVAQ